MKRKSSLQIQSCTLLRESQASQLCNLEGQSKSNRRSNNNADEHFQTSFLNQGLLDRGELCASGENNSLKCKKIGDHHFFRFDHIIDSAEIKRSQTSDQSSDQFQILSLAASGTAPSIKSAKPDCSFENVSLFDADILQVQTERKSRVANHSELEPTQTTPASCISIHNNIESHNYSSLARSTNEKQRTVDWSEFCSASSTETEEKHRDRYRDVGFLFGLFGPECPRIGIDSASILSSQYPLRPLRQSPLGGSDEELTLLFKFTHVSVPSGRDAQGYK